jgi:4-hydroxybenzoate polyprenyltransferase
MKSFIRLIRLPNLLIMAGTQYLMRYAVIAPMLALSAIDLQLSHFDFFLLSLSTVLIAAAGYAINDYFDTGIDRVNHPDTVVVGVSIKRRVVMGAHLVISILGIFLGFYVGYKAGIYKLGIIHFIASGLLWFYSTDLKGKPIIGNFVIAILAALVPILVPLYEIPLLNAAYGDILIETGTNFNFLFKFIGGFAAFAFLLTLIREIIKDMEDVQGDMAYGLRTMPVKFGIHISKKIVLFLIALVIAALAYLQYKQVVTGDIISFAYLLLAVQLPLFYLVFRIRQAQTPEEFHAASSFTKLIMILGVLYSVLIFVVLSDFNLFNFLS